MALDFAGRDVLVVGAGVVATRKVKSLLDDGARVHVVAPDASAEIEDWAVAGALKLSRRVASPTDLDGVWLAIAAINDPAVSAQVAQWALDARVWCINASDAAVGTARSVAQSRVQGMVVGVASESAPDPARAKTLLAALMTALDHGAASLRNRRTSEGRVVLVGAGPGAADLLTLRGSRALASADVVIHDRLGTDELVAALPADVTRIDVGKQPDNHPVPQQRINELLVEHARAGHTVVRLKGGDPFIFGRGGEEVHACLAAGVPVEVIPGVTSALSVPALAGMSVTQRAVAPGVIITTGHAGAEPAALAAMASGVTAVFLMAVSMLAEIADAALGAGVAPGTPVAIIENGSTPSERITRGELSQIARVASEAGVQPPAVIVVGAVAADGFLASDACAT
jgi:uroporphyrin-III C-methyltransferase/precorrin-2 dehydrogenase/sirohydrochlorin ferrochelatase